jgi:hypothetical protein
MIDHDRAYAGGAADSRRPRVFRKAAADGLEAVAVFQWMLFVACESPFRDDSPLC